MAIWAGQCLQPDEPLYNMVLVFRIDAALDPKLFQAAFRTLVDKCDVLRTVVEDVDNQPLQRALSHFAYDLEFLDFSAAPDPEAYFETWLSTRKTLTFDLGERHFDSALVQLSEQSFVWYLNQHHLLTDAWSVSLLYRKLQALYGLAREGRLDDADALPNFSDHVARDIERQDRPQRRKAVAWWRDKFLQKALPATFYRPTPPDRRGGTVRVPCPLGSDRSRRLHELAETEAFQSFTKDLSLSRIIATVLFAYLNRLSGNQRIVIGTPSHGRTSAELKKTPGLFIELFPLLVEIDDGETFITLHQKIAEEMQSYLLNAVPGSSNLEQSRGFDVILNYITASFGDFDGAPMRSEWVHADHGDRSHLLRLQVQNFDQAQELMLFLDLNADCFVGEERQWAAKHFLALLDAFLANPDSEIAAVALLDDQEKQTLTEGCNGIPATLPPGETVVQMFEKQASATPNQVALVCDDLQLTYRELDHRADRLAGNLGAMGSGPGSNIAVCMERSIDAVVALLGIMKCGAAYLPIDPQTPTVRLNQILANAKAAIVLTEGGFEGRPPGEVATFATLDTILRDAPGPDGITPPARAGLDDVAYILHTSGSTGGPKGVIVGHGGLANYISWAARHYLQGEVLDFPLFTALTFDLTVTSLFLPLVTGGRVVIYPSGAGRGDLPILDVIDDDQVDIVKLTPAHLSLIQNMNLAASRIRKLVVGGENFRTDLARTVLKRFSGQVEVYNEYGPTEGTVACMIHRFDPETDKGASVPIGRSIDNLDVYILDEHRQLVPRGVTGEIYIGGRGVAKGYLNNADETARRFIDNPFRPGETIYRTGDLARWDPNGCMAYLGREDHQIKVRGVRIEPGEIESALLERSEISACVVDLAKQSVGPGAAVGAAEACLRCGLPSAHPDAKIDGEMICTICRDFESKRDLADAFFGTMDDLRAIVAEIKGTTPGKPDCMILLSGGKDSSYALCQLVELGLTPLVFTLDNGFIAEGAKANVRRIADQLGLEVVVGKTPAMNAIFVDSLNRFSDVCNGCFKTIFSLSTNLARERGLTTIFTGLSRGQIFETRLADLFKQGVIAPDEIDSTIIEARKAYHRMDDAVSRLLDVSLFKDDAVFEEIRFVDFYRYCDTTLDEVLRYLGTKAPWIRPSDSGRSTNCLINDLGIHVHKTERGYHNYAAPYSWDVRLGHKERDAAMAELDDDIDFTKVNGMLSEIGYRTEAPKEDRTRLVAYYVAPQVIPTDELRRDLAQRLPREFLPNDFVRLDHIPLTRNDKIDRAALPRPDAMRPALGADYVLPSTEIESQLSVIWCEVLGLETVGVEDNFFDLGGDSILNIRIVARSRKLGLTMTPQQIFDFPTIASLAPMVTQGLSLVPKQGDVTGQLPLTPIQSRYFANARTGFEPFTQTMVLALVKRVDPVLLEKGLQTLQRHHDGLRTRFTLAQGSWRQTIDEPGHCQITVERIELGAVANEELDAAIDRIEAELAGQMKLSSGDLVRAALVGSNGDDPDLLILAIHHLVVDGVSWWILLEDLEAIYNQLAEGKDAALGDKSSSIMDWSNALSVAAGGAIGAERSYWKRLGEIDGSMPRDHRGVTANGLTETAALTAALDSEETDQLIHRAAGRFGAQLPDLLTAALVQTLVQWTGRESIRFDMEGHGREEIFEGIELSRTVGWFTSVFPTAFELPTKIETRAAIASIREQAATVPNRGIGYGILRYLDAESAGDDDLSEFSPADILFNYLGQWDKALAGSTRFKMDRPISVFHGSKEARSHAIEIAVHVHGGRLRFDWVYSRNLYERTTIEKLAADYLSYLRAIITDSLGIQDSARSSIEFPLADLTQNALDDLLEEFAEPVSGGG